MRERLGCKYGWVGGSSECPELEIDKGTVSMHCVGYLDIRHYYYFSYNQHRRESHLFPCLDLVLTPYPRYVIEPAGLGRDQGALCYEERARSARSLGIIRLHEWVDRDMCLPGRSEASKWCKNYTVLEGFGTNCNWLEKFGGGRRGSHCRKATLTTAPCDWKGFDVGSRIV